MTSASKEHDERKREIIETGASLFSEFGYDDTSVNMIIEEIGIAKGTFYHYFRSKDELLEEIVDLIVEKVRLGILDISRRTDLDAMEKLAEGTKFFRTVGVGNEGITEFLHEDRNAHWHLKLEKKLMPSVYDAYETIIRQGMEEGKFVIKYPRETAVALLGATNAMVGRDHDHTGTRMYDPEFIKAVLDISGRILGVPFEEMISTFTGEKEDFK